jgi:hypothetical protein
LKLFTVFLLALQLGLFMVYIRVIHELLPATDPRPTIVLTERESAKLLKYHGTNALRIERNNLYIWRGNRWQEVAWNK